MTENELESLTFYVINDATLINALLWGNFDKIENYIDLINNDGMTVLKEVETCGPARFGKDPQIALKKYNLFKKRFKPFSATFTKQDVLNRAYSDIENLQNLMQPSETELTLYRNIKPEFLKIFDSNSEAVLRGLSSCSLYKHDAENKMYGSDADCITIKIKVPAGFPVIRVDELEEIRNEPDEVILPPMLCKISKHQVKNAQNIEISCIKPLKIDLTAIPKYFINPPEQLEKS